MKRVLLLAALMACDESNDLAPDPLRGLPERDAHVDAPFEDAEVQDMESGDAGTKDSGTAPDLGIGNAMLVINEVQASGDDWVEIRNVGTTPADVSGIVLTQTDDAGEAELDRAPAFPDGYILPAGGYFIVLAGREVLEGVQTECTLPGVFQCLVAEFGISNGNGDTLVLVRDDLRLDELVLPPNAAGADETYGRLPDGEGEFAVNVPTPLAPNRAP